MGQLLENRDINDFMAEYELYREHIRKGNNWRTALFWISYMDEIWLVLILLQDKQLCLYAQFLLMMQDLFFSFGGQNYARYMTFKLSSPGATELLERGPFRVARSIIAGNECAVDKRTE